MKNSKNSQSHGSKVGKTQSPESISDPTLDAKLRDEGLPPGWDKPNLDAPMPKAIIEHITGLLPGMIDEALDSRGVGAA